MRHTLVGLAATAAALLAHAGVHAVPAFYSGEGYVVLLKPNVTIEEHVSRRRNGTDNIALSVATDITDRFEFDETLKGYVARLGRYQAAQLSLHPDVQFIEEDSIYRALAVQPFAPSWGLRRLNSRDSLLKSESAAYTYPDTGGSGVRCYGRWHTCKMYS